MNSSNKTKKVAVKHLSPLKINGFVKKKKGVGLIKTDFVFPFVLSKRKSKCYCKVVQYF